MLREIFENVRERRPVIHSITNYVTANDCANILNACGASPIMADSKEEAADITANSNGLYLNIGTLNDNTLEAMLIAGKKANELGHPIVFDPVGIGASEYRMKAAEEILREVKCTVIRGNISEIRKLASGKGTVTSVDADNSDRLTADNLEDVINSAKSLSAKSGAVIAITGTIDIAADSKKAYLIRNGNPMMTTVAGTGCQTSALVTAFVASNPDKTLEATAGAMSAMGIAGEMARDRLRCVDGNVTYGKYIIDAIYNLTPDILESGTRYEFR